MYIADTEKQDVFVTNQSLKKNNKNITILFNLIN